MKQLKDYTRLRFAIHKGLIQIPLIFQIRRMETLWKICCCQMINNTTDVLLLVKLAKAGSGILNITVTLHWDVMLRF